MGAYVTERMTNYMWNPMQYDKFSDELIRPAIELIARIPNLQFNSIIDLGCGDGKVTNILKTKYNPKKIIGIDKSKEMLNNAYQYKDISWQNNDINNIQDSFDLIFSNASLQWVDNHQLLLNKLILHTNKVLAMQVPNNYNYPSHILINETINEHPIFKEKLFNKIRQNPVLAIEEYYNLLFPITSRVDIWETQYLQQLYGDNPVLEWVKGTALTPVKANLNNQEYENFLLNYNKKLLTAYPKMNNITLFPFSRIFIVTYK